MPPVDRPEVTRTLVRARQGDASAVDSLMPLVYGELRRLADGYLAREVPGHTLQPTALVHEAFLRLVDAEGLEPVDRSHFIALAANVMRRVLVEHARARHSRKRGGAAERITLSSSIGFAPGPAAHAPGRDAAPGANVELLALDEALGRLAALDARQARVVELRFFGGLGVQEVADVIGVSKRSVEADWTLARAFLHRELSPA